MLIKIRDLKYQITFFPSNTGFESVSIFLYIFTIYNAIKEQGKRMGGKIKIKI